MIKLAFCDDEIVELDHIRRLLEEYRIKRDQKLDCISFQSPLELLTEIERGVRLDVLFLDVLMPGETGIDVASEIRKYDTNVKIIFLTSSAEFAVQSYTVGAYFYQLKPIRREEFFSLMDSVISACEKEQQNSMILRCRDGITRMELQQLEYCEVIHRTLFIHLTSGKVLETTGSLDELYRQLEPYGGFLRPHRSYIVNLKHVKALSYRGIMMSCLTQIPIPRGKYNEIKDAYLEYAFQNRQVMI